MAKSLKNARIVLENDTCLEGFFFGFSNSVYGEFIFNTSTTGYEELITDPSYNQQIVVMSFPVQGIYGVSSKFFESKNIQISGLVVYEINEDFEHFESEISLNKILQNNKVTGISGIDTRYLVKILREHGSLKGAIVPIDANINDVKKTIKNLQLSKHVEKVKYSQLDTYKNSENIKKLKLIVYNFGCKQSIINELQNIGFEVIIVPWNTKFSELSKYEYNGIFFGNGPGNPSELTQVITEIKKMIKAKKKLIGICFGTQLISLALGLKTFKLNYGHHSINHPVKNLFNNKVFITSQNHIYAVDKNSLTKDVDVWLESVNDGSIEGIYSKKYNVMSVQFHPEASPGPLESKFIFEEFYKFIKGEYE